jgi:putative alpha-1,2-mannosidase
VSFGSVKVSIDTYEPNITFSRINGGYTPRGLLTGASMLHVSGTGGNPKYGLIPQMPLTIIEAPVNLLHNTTYWQNRLRDDRASVGYYAIEL